MVGLRAMGSEKEDEGSVGLQDDIMFMMMSFLLYQLLVAVSLIKSAAVEQVYYSTTPPQHYCRWWIRGSAERFHGEVQCL